MKERERTCQVQDHWRRGLVAQQGQPGHLDVGHRGVCGGKTAVRDPHFDRCVQAEGAFFKDTLFFWDIFFYDAFLHQINGLEIQADPICSLWEDLRG